MGGGDRSNILILDGRRVDLNLMRRKRGNFGDAYAAKKSIRDAFSMPTPETSIKLDTDCLMAEFQDAIVAPSQTNDVYLSNNIEVKFRGI